MSAVPIAVVITVFAAVLPVLFWWFAEVRARWSSEKTLPPVPSLG